MITLKPCPCGKVPEKIDIFQRDRSFRFIGASPVCCGWLLEAPDDNRWVEDQWNAAPRQGNNQWQPIETAPKDGTQHWVDRASAGIKVVNKIVLLPILLQVQWEDNKCVVRLPAWALPEMIITGPGELGGEMEITSRLQEMWDQIILCGVPI